MSNSLEYRFTIGGPDMTEVKVKAHNYSAAMREVENKVRDALGLDDTREIVLREVIIPDVIRMPE
jgi:hypothetical protein